MILKKTPYFDLSSLFLSCTPSLLFENTLPEDMDTDAAKEELEDWNDWAKENPDKANAELEYPGY